jgi:hypothetical protein
VRAPRHGETVRDGAVYLELVVARTEIGSHEGWYTIHGGVRHEECHGSPWHEPRAVYAELQDDGVVRMLSKDERINSDRG